MPFTFCHPAIVLPLCRLQRKWISITGLVAGSIAPDFEYFLRMRVESRYSHTLAGLFWLDLPLALILCCLFHGIARDSLFENLPRPIKTRLLPFSGFHWLTYLKANRPIVVCSIVIGAASHLFWDSFTHLHGFFVVRLSCLKNSFLFLGVPIPGFKIAQHLSTLCGGMAIAYALWRLPKNNDQLPRTDIRYWYYVAGVTALIIAVRLLVSPDSRHYGHLIVTTISAGLISLVVVPAILRLHRAI